MINMISVINVIISINMINVINVIILINMINDKLD